MLINLEVNDKIRQKNIKRCREKGILLPTFKEMLNPSTVSDDIKDKLSKTGLWDVDPVNLYRITWHNEPKAKDGKFGDVNFIEGVVISQEQSNVIFETAAGDSFILNSDKALEIGAIIWLSIRPEKVSVSKTKPEGINNVLQGKVDDIAYSGNISTYYVRLGNGSTVKAQAANSRRLSARGITWEDEVWLSWTDTAAIALSE